MAFSTKIRYEEWKNILLRVNNDCALDLGVCLFWVEKQTHKGKESCDWLVEREPYKEVL